MVCHSVCGADDMTDVTIWQNFPHPLLPCALTLGNCSARRSIFIPKVRRKYAFSRATP